MSSSPEDEESEARQRPGGLHDPYHPQNPKEREEHDQGVQPVTARVAALYGRERELRHELDEEQTPERPAQGREPPLPRTAHLPGQLDDHEQHQREGGQGEQHVKVTVEPIEQLLARRRVVSQSLRSC